MVVAAPLLFAGTIFHQISHRLQVNGFNNAEYASAEFAASAALDRQAKQNTVQAEEDQALVTELEADVTRHGEEVGTNEAIAGENAVAVGGDEAVAATEAGTAAAVEAVPGVNVAADIAEGSAIAGQEVAAVGSALNAIKSEGLALVEGGQATADGNLALEKEAEADSLLGASTVEEGASVASKRQGARSALLASGEFVEAFFCQLVAAVFQLPVVVLLATKKASMLTTVACDGCIGVSATSWIMSRLSLLATVGSLVAVPWASTVLAASGGSELFSEAAVATGLGGRSRLLKSQNASHEPSFLNGLNPFAKANTATTTVQITTPAPPARESHLEMFTIAVSHVFSHFAHWSWHVLMDVGLISLAFAAAGFAFGTGRHISGGKRGTLSHKAAAGNVLRYAVDHWLWGFTTLIAIWVISILMAKELQPIARHVQHGRVGILICAALGLLCLAAHALHGCMHVRAEMQNERQKAQSATSQTVLATYAESKALLSAEGIIDRSRLSERSTTLREVEVADIEAGEDDEYGSNVAMRAGGVAACLCAMVAASFEPVLQAVESPINAWALGGSYQTVVMCWSLFTILSWEALAKSFTANFVHLIIALVTLLLAVWGTSRLYRHLAHTSTDSSVPTECDRE